MALYDLNNRQVEFIKRLIEMVVPQNFKRDDMMNFLNDGNVVMNQLNKPVHPAGKPNLVKQAEADVKGLTDQEKKVIAEL